MTTYFKRECLLFSNGILKRKLSSSFLSVTIIGFFLFALLQELVYLDYITDNELYTQKLKKRITQFYNYDHNRKRIRISLMK